MPLKELSIAPAMPFQITRVAEAADIDMMGHVNNIIYLRWAQEVAIAHWESIAAEKDKNEIGWVVLRHEIDYKASAHLDDEVIIQTWVGLAEGLLFERHTKILHSDGRLLAQARTLWCPIDLQSQRPKRVSPKLRAQFSYSSQTS